jgi:DNA-binding NtrC family response regulator
MTDGIKKMERSMRGTKQILIIDDCKAIVDALQEFFTEKYKVITACNGHEGLEVLEHRRNEIGLVITDLRMPELSGVGLISVMKKKFPTIPIIAMTGWREDFIGSMTRLHVDKVVDKPFDLGHLEKMVSTMLDD